MIDLFQNLSGLVVLLVAILSLGFLIRQLIPWIRIFLFALSLKGPKVKSFLGNMPIIVNFSEIDKLANVCYKKYGPVFPCWMSAYPIIVIYQPEHLQVILGNNKYMEKAFMYPMMKPYLGDGLIIAAGSRWKLHRKYMQPYFNIQLLENGMNTAIHYSKMLVQNLPSNGTLDIVPHIIICSQNITHKYVLDVSCEDITTYERSPFTKMKYFGIIRLKKPLMFLKSLYSFTSTNDDEAMQTRRIRSYIKEILERRIRDVNQNNGRCLLDNLLEINRNHSDFSIDDVIDETSTIMLAGNDTISSACSYVLYVLAKNKRCQEKAREEVDEIYRQSGTDLSITDLSNMKYLTCCIKEALRLYPSVPYIGRLLTEDVKLDDYTIPAGTTIIISPYITHRQPHLYLNPQEYIPERFFEEEDNKRHRYAYIPFSTGPRICIGFKYAMLELKIILSMILHHFNFSLEPGDQSFDRYYEIIMHPKALRLKLEKRF